MDIFTALLIIAGIALYLFTLSAAIRQSGMEIDRKRLEESFAAVSEGEFEWHTPTWTERLSGVAGSFLGRKGGRAIRLSSRNAICYAVQLRHHPPDLVIGEADLRQRLSGKQAEELAGALHHLFKVLGFQQLEVADGWLVVYRLPSQYALSETSVRGVFDALLRVDTRATASPNATRPVGCQLRGLAGELDGPHAALRPLLVRDGHRDTQGTHGHAQDGALPCGPGLAALSCEPRLQERQL